MNSLRKFAGISVLFIIVFMVVALFQFQSGDDMPKLLPDQFEYDFNEGWTVAVLESDGLGDHQKNKELFQKAFQRSEKRRVGNECGW